MEFVFTLVLVAAMLGLGCCAWQLAALLLKLCLHLICDVAGLVRDIALLTIRGPKYLAEINATQSIRN